MSQRPHHQSTHTARLMIGGKVFDHAALHDAAQADSLQQALDAARQKYGHALCLCRRQKLKLQVRLRDGLYHLAVWPNEGPLHDAQCIFFRDDLNLYLSHSHTQPTMTLPPSSGGAQPESPKRRHLRLAMPGYVRVAPELSRPPAPSFGGNDKDTDGSTAAPVMNLKSLAMLLWREASLCRWHHSWQRDWGRARHELVAAACQITINGTDLDSMLFVPRVFRESAKDALNAQWERFVTGLIHRKPALALLIAPVRSYSTGDDRPAVIRLRHLRHPVGLSQSCNEFIDNDCKAALRQVQTNLDYPRIARNEVQERERIALRRNPEVMGFFLVEASSRGGLWAKAGWLMSVHPGCFIPTNNPNQVMLVDALIEQGYTFQRVLTDATPMKKTAPDWIVRHVLDPKGVPVPRAALDITDRGQSLEYLQARAAMSRRMAEQGIPTWYWMPVGTWSQRTVPPLPPHDHLPRDQAHHAINLISAGADSDYRYGPSPRFHQFIHVHQ